MSRIHAHAFLLLAAILLAAISAFAGQFLTTDPTRNGSDGIYTSAPREALALADSVRLIGPWGSVAPFNGQFQDQSGNSPAWNGWTHADATVPDANIWHISDFMAADLDPAPGNLAMYCGDETLPACPGEEGPGGYGNAYNEGLRYTYTVADASAPAVFTVSGIFSHDLEPGYDFVHFNFLTTQGTLSMAQVDGQGTAVPFEHQHAYMPSEYLGPDQDQVIFEILVISDGGFSDADCQYPSNGACQVDNLRVVCDNGGLDETVDFQDGPGGWETLEHQGVGDFTQIWSYLQDIDLCQSNYSPQVAFIDDGLVVPGVGPSECINWCYGPMGYVVNTTGGRFGNTYQASLHNQVISPVITWPGNQFDGLRFDFDAYLHETLGYNSPAVFAIWSVRSASDPAAIEDAPWRSREVYYYGGPEYKRFQEEVGDLLVPDCAAVQVMMGVQQIVYIWPWSHDATPAPYFDNVRLTAYENGGPILTALAANLAQDGFPASGVLDEENLADNSVRFDSAIHASFGGFPGVVPGDSLVCRIVTRRPGAALTSTRLHYTMQRNPVFADVRDPAWPAEGFVEGQPISGQEDLFAFDLPDEGFLFPGDILHYHFAADDAVSGGDVHTRTLPADLPGYGDFSDPRAYEAAFTMHALPTIRDEHFLQPEVLFWDDSGGSTNLDKWLGGFAAQGLQHGMHFDVYRTSSASSSLGNGLGGRATLETLGNYRAIFYSSGDLIYATLDDGSGGSSQDVQLLSSWLDEEARNLFLCGDNLASDLQQTSGGATFLSDYLNLQFFISDIRPVIANQTTPLVRPEPGNPVFGSSEAWVAYGGCLGVNTFDGVQGGEGSLQLARFCNPSGQPAYDYSAATLNIRPNGSCVVSMPVDLGFVYTEPSYPPPPGIMDMAHLVLMEVLDYFGIHGPIGPVQQPQVGKFRVGNHPNPFNPITRIEYNLPRQGRIAIRVYNVRGELVRTLLDEEKPAGTGHVLWDGTGASGQPVGSGVYFYKAVHDDQTTVQKMTLVK